MVWDDGSAPSSLAVLLCALLMVKTEFLGCQLGSSELLEEGSSTQADPCVVSSGWLHSEKLEACVHDYMHICKCRHPHSKKKNHRGAPTLEENGEMKGRFVSLSILWSDHGRCLLILAEHWR